MSEELHRAVGREIESLASLLWLTPFLAKRLALLTELRDHIEAGWCPATVATTIVAVQTV